MKEYELFFRRNPFIKLVIPLITGIFLSQWNQLSNTVLELVLIGLLSVYAFLFVFTRFVPIHYRTSPVLPLILFFLLGIYLPALNETKVASQLGKKIRLAYVTKEAQEKNKSFRYILCFQEYDSVSKQMQSHKILSYIQKDSTKRKLNIGDYILFEANLQEISPSPLPGGFDYQAFMKRRNVLYQTYIDSSSWIKTGKHRQEFPFRQASIIRKKLIDVLDQSNMKSENTALLKAMLLGKKDALDGSVKESYSIAGAMHVLAVSGLHVGILLGLLNFVFSFMYLKKLQPYKVILIILCIWTYAFITGLSASVMRAAFMFSLISGKSITKRSADIFNALFASAFIMLIYNPNYLWDLGFILSYSAVLGILVFFPEINSLFNIRNRILKPIWEVSVIGISAQLGTIPVITYNFHQIPTYFLITNLWLLLFTSVIMFSGIAYLCISMIPLIKEYLGMVMDAVLSLFQNGIKLIASLPMARLGFSVDHWGIIFLLVMVSFVFILLRYRRSYALLSLLACVLVFQAYNFLIQYKSLHHNELICGSINKTSFVYIQQGLKSKCYYQENPKSAQFLKSIQQLNISRNIHFAEFKKIETLKNSSDLFESLKLPNGEIISWIQNKKLLKFNTNSPFETDILLVDSVSVYDLEKLYERIRPRTVLWNGKAFGKAAEKLKQVCEMNNTELLWLRKNPVYIRKLD